MRQNHYVQNHFIEEDIVGGIRGDLPRDRSKFDLLAIEIDPGNRPESCMVKKALQMNRITGDVFVGGC